MTHDIARPASVVGVASRLGGAEVTPSLLQPVKRVRRVKVVNMV